MTLSEQFRESNIPPEKKRTSNLLDQVERGRAGVGTGRMAAVLVIGRELQHLLLVGCEPEVQNIAVGETTLLVEIPQRGESGDFLLNDFDPLGHLGGRETPTDLLGRLVDVAHVARVPVLTGMLVGMLGGGVDGGGEAENGRSWNESGESLSRNEKSNH
jgi:hypothetical protein